MVSPDDSALFGKSVNTCKYSGRSSACSGRFVDAVLVEVFGLRNTRGDWGVSLGNLLAVLEKKKMTCGTGAGGSHTPSSTSTLCHRVAPRPVLILCPNFSLKLGDPCARILYIGAKKHESAQ